ncbi:hypothetical protein P7L87_25285 [Vibrio parahaemolyticus]|nr:hypothetical protein [Vibrio parahaemolyticus]
MNTATTPHLETFWAGLRAQVDRKKRVTAVTRVTTAKSGTYQLQGFVTPVTDVSGPVPVCPDVEERQAMMEIDGHVPPVFSLAFAAFQSGCPSDRAVKEWRRAIDDAGRFLDGYGQQAASVRWQSSDLFGAEGLAWAIRGTTVAMLSGSGARLSDGRLFERNLKEVH